mmetsp:Transcript_44230/g.44778  ORF Transcript_44230/g.44778 Transcript_44230/m.44778 type:complete len:85 (-) Transcript_44230:2-256(-)
MDVTVVIDGAQRNDAFTGGTTYQGLSLLLTYNDEELENVMDLEEDGNAIMGNTDKDDKETTDEELLDDNQIDNIEDMAPCFFPF